jgi:pantetheine-phosphate adenylyltransferase
MLPGLSYSYLSSKLVREIAQLGAPLKGLVPPIVEERLRAKVPQTGKERAIANDLEEDR